MSFLKKGPEIKLSELKLSKLKAPAFLADVYYDLKDRHLLPVALILLVAIVAVPIAIGSSSGSEEEVAPGEAGASQSAVERATGELVAEATPGLRAYGKRLDGKGAIDPFRAPPKDEPAESSAGGGEGESGAPSGSSESFESPEGGGSTPSVPPFDEGADGQPVTPGKLTYYSYAIDVRITGGSGENRKTTVRRNLPELTMLPSRETPAIVYMGSTRDGKKAVMTVSSDVQAIFGDAKCVLGSQTCQLLAMEEGLPQTFVYGGAGKTYKIELVKIHLVETDKLNKAPLGEGDKKKDKGGKNERAAGLSDADQG